MNVKVFHLTNWKEEEPEMDCVIIDFTRSGEEHCLMITITSSTNKQRRVLRYHLSNDLIIGER